MRSLLLLFLLISIQSKLMSQNNPAKQTPVFNHGALYVTDFKKSVEFYTQVMGFDTVPEPFKDGRHAWFRIGEGLTLHVIGGAPAVKEYYLSHHLCFSVGSLKDFIAVLDKNKIEWGDSKGKTTTITLRADGVQQIYFKDPDGYWIEVNDEKM